MRAIDRVRTGGQRSGIANPPFRETPDVKISKLLLLAAFAVPAAALPVSTLLAAAPADPIKARHRNFENMGRATKAVFDQLRKGAPDMRVIQANANALAASAPRVATDFPRGSGPESGRKTHALPAIWQNPAEFSKLANQLTSTTRSLQAAAAGGNLAQVKVAAGQVGATCKGCHDQFRKPH